MSLHKTKRLVFNDVKTARRMDSLFALVNRVVTPVFTRNTTTIVRLPRAFVPSYRPIDIKSLKQSGFCALVITAKSLLASYLHLLKINYY
jgi:hypothetical protein